MAHRLRHGYEPVGDGALRFRFLHASALRATTIVGWIAAALLKLPVYVYRWTLKPYVGWNCRHLPTCSEYAIEAIDQNGAWRGGWLTAARLCRCHPWGSSGYDPVPDVRMERHLFTPWRYGRWSWRTSRM